jgi:hypothetical protein
MYAGDFPAGSKAAELLDLIKAEEAEAKAGSTSQATGDGGKRAGSQTKAALYDDLYENLRPISRTAKAMADEIPGLNQKFRMPRSPSYTEVLTTARVLSSPQVLYPWERGGAPKDRRARHGALVRMAARGAALPGAESAAGAKALTNARKGPFPAPSYPWEWSACCHTPRTRPFSAACPPPFMPSCPAHYFASK